MYFRLSGVAYWVNVSLCRTHAVKKSASAPLMGCTGHHSSHLELLVWGEIKTTKIRPGRRSDIPPPTHTHTAPLEGNRLSRSQCLALPLPHPKFQINLFLIGGLSHLTSSLRGGVGGFQPHSPVEELRLETELIKR